MASSDDSTKRVGPYALVAPLGRGGMGEVSLALAPQPAGKSLTGRQRAVVLKRLRAELRGSPEAKGRFLDEARIALMINHPNIARTLDAGISDNGVYIAFEFIAGCTVKQMTKGSAPLPPAVALHVACELLAGLDYAHELVDPDTQAPLRVVHRDVSPQNVMLCFDGRGVLLDFGVAFHLGKKIETRTDAVVGKLRYLPPEYLKSGEITPEGDLFCVAILLYEMWTGGRYFGELRDDELWDLHRGNQLYRPPQYEVLPDGLRRVLDVALDVDPARRYRSARAMRNVLLDIGRKIGLVDLKDKALGYIKGVLRDDVRRVEAMLVLADEMSAAEQAEPTNMSIDRQKSSSSKRGNAIIVGEPTLVSEVDLGSLHGAGSSDDEGTLSGFADDALAVTDPRRDSPSSVRNAPKRNRREDEVSETIRIPPHKEPKPE